MAKYDITVLSDLFCRSAVGMGTPMGTAMGMPMGMGMGWVWGWKFRPHGSPVFLSMKDLTPEATTINCKIILFIMTYESIFFSARLVGLNIWNSLPNSVVDACTVNAFKAGSTK